MDHVSVDVPTADLVGAGDNIVGNIVYLSKADPALIRGAIERMQQLARGTVIGGHMGRFSATVLDNAIHYLGRLRDTVVALHPDGEPWKAAHPLARIPIDTRQARTVPPEVFEREWTQDRNENGWGKR